MLLDKYFFILLSENAEVVLDKWTFLLEFGLLFFLLTYSRDNFFDRLLATLLFKIDSLYLVLGIFYHGLKLLVQTLFMINHPFVIFSCFFLLLEVCHLLLR